MCPARLTFASSSEMGDRLSNLITELQKEGAPLRRGDYQGTAAFWLSCTHSHSERPWDPQLMGCAQVGQWPFPCFALQPLHGLCSCTPHTPSNRHR